MSSGRNGAVGGQGARQAAAQVLQGGEARGEPGLVRDALGQGPAECVGGYRARCQVRSPALQSLGEPLQIDAVRAAGGQRARGQQADDGGALRGGVRWGDRDRAAVHGAVPALVGSQGDLLPQPSHVG